MKVAATLGILHFGFTYATLAEELTELDDAILPGVADFLPLPGDRAEGGDPGSSRDEPGAG
jgi:hypothetical protein